MADGTRCVVGHSALLAATSSGSVAVVRMLLQAGARTDIQQPQTQHTALVMAEAHGFASIALLLRAAEAAQKGRREK